MAHGAARFRSFLIAPLAEAAGTLLAKRSPMRAAVLVFGLSILLNWARPAAAQAVVAEPHRGSADTTTTTEWYGGGILISDAATLAAWAAGIGGEPSLGYVGLASYLVVPQIIHGVHGNGGGIALSLVTRMGAPIVFAGLLAATTGENCANDDPETEDMCRQRRLGRALVAGGVGILTAMVLDAAVYARRRAPRRSSALSLVPRVDWSKTEGWSIGAAGRF